jgi:hypothetical protein
LIKAVNDILSEQVQCTILTQRTAIAFSWVGSVKEKEFNVFIQCVSSLAAVLAVGVVLLLVGHFTTPVL